MKPFSSIKKFFNELRLKLKNHPVIYAFIGGIGIILFWRGIWHTTDFVSVFLLNHQGEDALNYANLVDSLASTIIGFVLLLLTGLFVTDFISSEIISTSAKTEKKIEKITEETEEEEETEEKRLDEIEKKFDRVTNHLDEHLENIEKKLKDK